MGIARGTCCPGASCRLAGAPDEHSLTVLQHRAAERPRRSEIFCTARLDSPSLGSATTPVVTSSGWRLRRPCGSFLAGVHDLTSKVHPPRRRSLAGYKPDRLVGGCHELSDAGWERSRPALALRIWEKERTFEDWCRHQWLSTILKRGIGSLSSTASVATC